MKVKLTNPALDKKDDDRRVLCGGYHHYWSDTLRISFRNSFHPINSSDYYGFRLVRNK
jgi:formylglycine-generating enzyme required for sulfatase activity